MIEPVTTRMSCEVLCFELHIEPPRSATIGETRRLPWEVVKQYLTGPPLRIPPWRRPEPPPPAGT